MAGPIIDVSAYEKSHWSEQDKENVRSVLQFVQLLMNDHNFEEVVRQQQGKPYKQHNRTMTDGIQGVVTSVKGLTKNAPEFSYDVKYVFVDGDRVILHSHATLKSKHRGDESQGLNLIDIWKVADGHLVEHWDAVEGISFPMRLYGLLTGGKTRNNNGVF